MGHDLKERLTTLSALEPGWYANVGAKTGEACCQAMREAAAELSRLQEERKEIAAFLVEQFDEPDMFVSMGERGHYWRDKCITAGQRLDPERWVRASQDQGGGDRG
ncbi:hypothetical protein [Phenylobacterium sp. 58.2.17]|uniref:hypothetical protein n=1 Tax=Phenylobacterium sp. 58.2.17 TaxID=2969306 RepID=UPI002263D96A|nr:hypothetical protein [Phenylobacterium sp. 58.2.17]MCX7585066.1 hypothetical protein [Phenylobacterium sp. 58.2.17]